MAAGECYIGTSGWNYKHWANNRFYPKGLKPGEWLAFLAEHFNTVEVNYSFYRMPSPEAVSGWQSATPDEFLLAVKLWRGITHYKKLKEPGNYLVSFLDIISVVGQRRRGPLLVQLPPQMGPDLQRLDGFLTMLDELTAPSPWRVAVEFRHTGWLTPPVYRLLDGYRAALVLADSPRCPIREPNDVDFIYIRRHGSWQHHEGRYLPQQIEEDAARIRDWLTAGQRVFVYYNNDAFGHAVDNGRQLREQLRC
jgi:uncharacterized protein YecE (DUF72 family)